MKNKILLTLAVLALASTAHARGHLTGDANNYGLSVTETVTQAGAATISSQVGAISFNGTNYGILSPSGSTADASPQLGVLGPFSATPVLMSSTQAPASEQSEVAQLQAAANQASTGDGSGNSSCFEGGDHNFNDCSSQCTQVCEIMGAQDSCEQYETVCSGSGTGTPFENPFAGEVWWACNGVNLPPTFSQLQSQVSSYFQAPATYAGIKASMTSLLSTQGIPSAAFQYKQTIQYADALPQAVFQTGVDAFGFPVYGCDPSKIKMDTAQVSFSFFLDQTGQITTSGGTATASNLQYLYIKYFSQAMQPNVPPPVTQYYPYAGQLEYQMLDANMQPLSAMQYVNVSGAYDAADNGDPSIQAAVTCIANNSNPGCSASAPDARALSMGVGGNNSATIIDYAAQVDVDYSSVSTSGTSSTNVMNWALQETSRTLTYPDCGFAILNNQGNYAMLIDSKTNRYLDMNNSINLINSATGQLQTTTTPFNVQKNQNPVSEVGSDDTSVLDPTGNNQGLIPLSEIQPQDILQLAPLTVVGSPPPSPYYAIGNTVCDVTNQQTLTPQCPSGFTASLDSTGAAICSGTCTSPTGQASACTQPGTFSATPWQ
jgi:hypothetical protein